MRSYGPLSGGPDNSILLRRADAAKRVVSIGFGVALQDLDAATRGRAPIAFARQVAMYLCHVAYEMSLSQIAMAFQRDRTTVSHACHLIEDRRDDASFDLRLEAMETLLRSGGTPPPDPRVGPPPPRAAKPDFQRVA